MRNKSKKLKTIVVLPAYNAQETLKKTVAEIPKNFIDEIILVDDYSSDKTFLLAKKLGLVVYRHKKNQGYGANQKTCYQIALKKKADIIIMLHPDYQYNPKLISFFVPLIKMGYFDLMLGTRIRSREEALKSGMPLYKYLSNRFLSFFQNILTGQNLSEWHTGFRVYHRKVLQAIDFTKFRNDFLFDTQMLLAAVEKKFKIGEISIPARYHPQASSIGFWPGLKYGLGTLFLTIIFFIRKMFYDKNKLNNN
jgi:glycosyltransferase involved in cell wall biosynthesis